MISRTRICALAAALIAGLAVSSTAAAAPPCAGAILDEWLDTDEVENVYPLDCYQAAIDAIPEDIRIYTNAEDVIARAFQQAAGHRLDRKPQGQVDPPSAPEDVPLVDTSSSSTSVPIPLVVLGGMSAVLLAAGGAGYLSRRRRESSGSDG